MEVESPKAKEPGMFAGARLVARAWTRRAKAISVAASELRLLVTTWHHALSNRLFQAQYSEDDIYQELKSLTMQYSRKSISQRAKIDLMLNGLAGQ